MSLGLRIQMNFGSLQCKQIWNVLSSPQVLSMELLKSLSVSDKHKEIYILAIFTFKN